MKLGQVHVHYAPSRDQVLLVHKAAARASHERMGALDATAAALRAVVGWVCRDSLEEARPLPSLVGAVVRGWRKVRPSKGGTLVATATREFTQHNGQRVVFEVKIYENAFVAEGTDADSN